MKNYGNCKPYNLTTIQEILHSIGFAYIASFFGTWFYVIFTGEQLNGFRRNAFSRISFDLLYIASSKYQYGSMVATHCTRVSAFLCCSG